MAIFLLLLRIKTDSITGVLMAYYIQRTCAYGPADKRHKGRKSKVLHLINQVYWNTFFKLIIYTF